MGRGQASYPTVLFIRPEGPGAAQADYVLRLFARTAGFTLRVRVPGAKPVPGSSTAPLATIIYADATDVASELADPSTPRPVLAIRRSAFFGHTYLDQPDLPAPPTELLALADPDSFAARVVRPADGVAEISADLIAAAFWFLSRYEEYVSSTPDLHGRFLCAHSVAPQEMYDRPLVNLWFRRLHELICDAAGTPPPPSPAAGHRATIALTHDVDLLAKYRGLRGVRSALGSLSRPSGGGDATGEMRYASLVIAGLRRDPYDSFDDLFALKERIGAAGTFFVQPGGGANRLDADYELDDAPLRRLLMRAKSAGDEIGVHPGYDSHLSAKAIRDAAEAVGRAAGRAVRGSRQHYLRFSMPETWRALVEAGIRYDSTLGFADRAGFRCGWSGPFHPFDVETGIELPLVEVPLIAMDVTLAIYEKIPGEKSIERISHLVEASAEAPGGVFVFLWHNTIRDRFVYPGYWDAFEYLFFAAAGSARFVTLGEAVKEFEKGKA